MIHSPSINALGIIAVPFWRQPTQVWLHANFKDNDTVSFFFCHFSQTHSLDTRSGQKTNRTKDGMADSQQSLRHPCRSIDLRHDEAEASEMTRLPSAPRHG